MDGTMDLFGNTAPQAPAMTLEQARMRELLSALASKTGNARTAILMAIVELADDSYYNSSQLLLADAEYDRLKAELKALDPAAALNVGATVPAGTKKHTHRVPMKSLANAFNEADVRNWFARWTKALGSPEAGIQVTLEPKLDGLAVCLIYENGALAKGVTRGNGHIGEDITDNLRKVQGVPQRLATTPRYPIPRYIELRGEVVMTHEGFELANQRRCAAGKTPFVNCRNGAAGALRKEDSNLAELLMFFGYGFGAIEAHPDLHAVVEEELGILDAMRRWGVSVPPGEMCSIPNGPDECLQAIAIQGRRRPVYAFDTDGVVVKVSQLSLRGPIGEDSHHPNWAFAYKFPAQQARTKVLAIDVQVGKRGTLTPVARLEPVFCGGTTISNVTLHNQRFIDEMDIRVGDHVWIERAGEVIPKIVRCESEDPGHGSRDRYCLPDRCPVCGAGTVDEGAYRLCAYLDCPAQRLGLLEAFCSRDGMNIEGVSEFLLQGLLDQKLVRDGADLFTLRKEDLLRLDRVGDGMADNALKAIAAAKRRPLHQVIKALSVPRSINERELAGAVGSLERLMEMTVAELEAIPGIGSVMARQMHTYLHIDTVEAMVGRLLKHVTIDNPKAAVAGPLTGSKFLFTGTLSMKRGDAEEMVRKLGGAIASSVSKELTYLVCGDSAGSKLDKAKKLGIPVLSEQEFLDLLNA